MDLFCGGGAITHRAMLTEKYERFIMNDIDGRLPKLFKDCAYGKYTVENHPKWVSRDEFNMQKDKDAYIALVWSFGNNGKDYIYGKHIEDFKHDYHRAVFENKPKLLERWGYKIEGTDAANPYDRYLFFNRQIKRIARSDLESIVRPIEIERLQSLESLQRLQNLQSLESLQRLQNLQSLQSLQRLQNLQSLQSDYQDVEIPNGALIYCDIPYASTNCGKYQGFNSERFYEWAEEQDNIFISEYQMPNDFICIAQTRKTILSAANGNSAKATERLYTNRKTYKALSS